MTMRIGAPHIIVVCLTLLHFASAAKSTCAQNLHNFIFPEQRSIEVRDPSELPRARIPDVPVPATVANLQPDVEPLEISLDDAIRIALTNSEVIRVLTGVSAASSGRTIYDAAIANTVNDQQRGPFDPALNLNNNWNRFEPAAWNKPTNDFSKASTDEYVFGLGLSKKTTSGGTMRLDVGANPQRFEPREDGFLNPNTSSSLEFKYTQPLLQGGGRAVNLAPLVLARIDTERSYFQFKDSVQELVRGVIEAYWALVFARTDRWAREKQVEQSAFAFRLAEARFELEIIDVRNKAQAQVSLQNFRSSLLAAQDSVLQREAALRNILGLPPTDGRELVPITPPASSRYQATWEELIQLAEQQRPDLIELKLVLEADQQRLLQARNDALPSLNAEAAYSWNGLEGEIVGGGRAATEPGRYTDWNLGVNFSVPLGLRRGRAQLRQQELIIARDRANLQQGLHSVLHVLAQDLRTLELFYERYKLANETREPALINLNANAERWRSGSILFVEVLLAITDWGNNISSEAQFLAQYNTQLATLERDTGTILETHGICFYEERYGSIGPMGRWHHDQCYPEAVQPSENVERYPVTDQPAEQFFDLRDPIGDRLRPAEQLPPPARRLPNPDLGPAPSALGPLSPRSGIAP